MLRRKEGIQLLQATCQMPHCRQQGSEQDQSQERLVWTLCPIQQFLLNHMSPQWQQEARVTWFQAEADVRRFRRRITGTGGRGMYFTAVMCLTVKRNATDILIGNPK